MLVVWGYTLDIRAVQFLDQCSYYIWLWLNTLGPDGTLKELVDGLMDGSSWECHNLVGFDPSPYET